MFVACGEPDVAERKYHEDKRLNDTDYGSQRIEREWGNDVGQSGKNSEHCVIGEHVRIETNAERKRAEEIVRQLDRQHQRREKQHRTQKAAQIPYAIRAEALHDIKAETNRSERKG